MKRIAGEGIAAEIDTFFNQANAAVAWVGLLLEPLQNNVSYV
jgi:hypothetical protein